MENKIDFSKRPFIGVFAAAAKQLKMSGKNARNIVRNHYNRGNRRVVRVVNLLVEKRLSEYEQSRALIERAVSIQKTQEVSNG